MTSDSQMHQDLIKMLEQLRREQDFFGRCSLTESEETYAHINILTHEIEIHYSPVTSSGERTERFLRKKNIRNSLESKVRDIFEHEVGHRGSRKDKGCPRNFKTMSEKFLDPVADITGWDDKEKLSYFCNSLTDIINNTTIKKINPDEGFASLNGLILFFDEQGQHTDGKITKMYEAYARLNLYFWGDHIDHDYLRPYFTFDPEINQAIRNFLLRTGISKMKTEIIVGDKKIKVRDREQVRKHLMDINNWEEISRIYAEEFGKFMEEQFPKESLFGAGGRGKLGPDSRKQSPADTDKNKGIDTKNIFPSQDGFGPELNKRENQKRLIRSASIGSGGPKWMNNFEYLTALYEMLAEDKCFELRLERMSARKSFPLIPLGRRPIKWEEDSVNDIIGTGITDEGKLEIMVANRKYEIKADVVTSKGHNPDIIFAFLDTSQSMKNKMPEGPPLGPVVNPRAPPEMQWRLNSRYHVSLVTYFMAITRFQEMSILDSDIYFVNFSTQTLIERGLKKSMKQALSPQFGGTRLDLDSILDSVKGNSLLFTISDGQIENYLQVLEKIDSLPPAISLFHIQIGEPTEYGNALLEKGINVVNVMKEDDLYHLIIEVTDKVYGGAE